MRRRTDILTWAGSLAVTVALVALWHVATAFKWVLPMYLPAPAATVAALADGLRHGELARQTLGTVERMVYGWLLASLAGVALGAAIGVSPALRVWLRPTLELLRPLPASSVLPLAIALFGLSPGMVLVVIAFGALWPVLLATAHGFSTIEPRLEEVARVLGLSRLQFIVKIGLPHALAEAFGGIRLALTVALILAVVGEMLASQEGLGTTILYAARSFRADELFAGVMLLGAIGFASNALLNLAERHLLAWKR